MKKQYFDLMEQVLSAYTDEHIVRYFEDVKQNGLREHGFARLTSNIGILIAQGKRLDLRPVSLEMMEFCCKTIPNVKAANDFTVREIVCCIRELEKNSGADAEDIRRWKAYLATIDPTTCYSVFARKPTDQVRNWALFTGVSEFFRQQMGLCDSTEFIDIQLESQFQWLDENGMYRDNAESEIHQPIVYDLVPRGLFSALLHAGYRGKHYQRIDDCLRKANMLTLKMQSVTGELAFGGRSNQFLHNEAWVAAIFEYEAVRYHREGDAIQAGVFKAAAAKALENMKLWLAKRPINHVKNRFSKDSKFGCEGYAYFDKYMITAASFLYMACMFCDDGIPAVEIEEKPEIWCTSRYFHKIFAKAGGYSLEFDTDGDPHYDASGLGRVHKKGAPSTVCLSVPCPEEPAYGTDLEKPVALSICPGILTDGNWSFATGAGWTYTRENIFWDDCSAEVLLRCTHETGKSVTAKFVVDETGVRIDITGEGKVACMLPAFDFDGETHTEIRAEDNGLTVSYEGSRCRYTTDGTLVDMNQHAGNRNGHYRVFRAEAENRVKVHIEIQ